MEQSQSQLPEALTDRGIGVQAVCFALTGGACLAILQSFQGSDFWLYQWFETATKDLYWSFIVPLGYLFDKGRKMFERGKAIREAKKAEMVKKAAEQGAKEEKRRIKKVLESGGVTLPPDVAEAAFGDALRNGH